MFRKYVQYTDFFPTIGGQYAALEFSDEQRAQLESVVQSISMSHGLVQRVWIVLACVEGVTHAKGVGRVSLNGREMAAPVFSVWGLGLS